MGAVSQKTRQALLTASSTQWRGVERKRQQNTFYADSDKMNLFNHRRYRQLEARFVPFADSYWGHLSRLTNLLIILNISLFFLTDLVTRHGYYYTFYSILFLALPAIGALLPFGLLHRLWYYLIFLFSKVVGIFFIVASVWYWVGTNGG